MKFRTVLIGLWLLAFPAIAVAETRVEINHTKNFRQYKTFTVEVEAPIRADGTVDEHNTIVIDQQRRAAEYQLRTRGLTEAAVDPDLTVRISTRESERTELVSSGWPAYPYGWYGPWGYGGYWAGPGYWGGSVWTYTYYVANVTFNVLERGSGDLVYRAQVTEDIDDDGLSEDVMKISRKAFKKFPIAEIEDD